jgi:hypothetical protein
LINANWSRDILWRKAPWSGNGEIPVDNTAGIGCALSHDVGEPTTLLANGFGFIARLSAHRGSEECSTSVLRDAAKAHGDATKHNRCSASKAGEDPIEVIELLESGGIIERRTASNNCASRHPLSEFIRGGQSVLTAF